MVKYRKQIEALLEAGNAVMPMLVIDILKGETTAAEVIEHGPAGQLAKFPEMEREIAEEFVDAAKMIRDTLGAEK